MSDLPDDWTTCAECGSAVPEVDAEEGICVDCWDALAFIANAKNALPPTPEPS